ncbi:hypothetical protein AB0H71_09895 [Nocardia sp. NPDC050697]|uniref:hypothetical protein n=1 Tax=Nocardia sp. NPDC050697 TaxID=3155158 RepID=UPI0033D3BAF2
MEHVPELFDSVISMSPAEIEKWVLDVDRPLSTFNWEGLAEVAGAEAMAGTRAVDLAWAQVALAVRNRLERRADSESEQRRQYLSGVRLRAEMVERHGARSDSSLLDCRDVLRKFTQRWSGRYDSVDSDAGQWRDLPRARILELRLLKNELSVLKRLAPFAVEIDEAIAPWMSLWNRLP